MRMDVEPIIRGVDAHKVYNSGAVKVHALRGVNLVIPRGEMVAIMGPSGCGKTTLLNCFSGLDDLTSGDVLIEGVSLASMDDNAKSRYRSRRMGFVFQLVNDPAIVWADEPTGNLDSETSAQIMDLLVRLNREQRQTLVLVTHDAAVSSRAHRILRMRNGEIVEETRGG